MEMIVDMTKINSYVNKHSYFQNMLDLFNHSLVC